MFPESLPLRLSCTKPVCHPFFLLPSISLPPPLFPREWHGGHPERERDSSPGPGGGVSVCGNCVVPCAYGQLDPKRGGCEQHPVQHQHHGGSRPLVQHHQRPEVPSCQQHHSGMSGDDPSFTKATVQLCPPGGW